MTEKNTQDIDSTKLWLSPAIPGITANLVYDYKVKELNKLNNPFKSLRRLAPFDVTNKRHIQRSRK